MEVPAAVAKTTKAICATELYATIFLRSVWEIATNEPYKALTAATAANQKATLFHNWGNKPKPKRIKP